MAGLLEDRSLGLLGQQQQQSGLLAQLLAELETKRRGERWSGGVADANRIVGTSPPQATATDSSPADTMLAMGQAGDTVNYQAGDVARGMPHALARGLLTGATMIGAPQDDPEMERLALGGLQSAGNQIDAALPKPETRLGKFAHSVTEVAANPLNWVGPGSAPVKAAWNAASGIGGEAGGQLYEGTPQEGAARMLGSFTPLGVERGYALAGMLPKGNVGVFGGRTAVTADHQALNRAEAMAKAGKPADDIWRDTGWFQGAEGKWRFEIPDDAAKLMPSGGGRLGDVLDHPGLYEAYPSLANAKVGALPESSHASASFTPGNWLARDKIEYKPSDAEAIEAVLHETQHAIQKREKFSGGSSITQELPLSFGMPLRSPKVYSKEFNDAVERYSRNAGEVEARNVERRFGLSPSQRNELTPLETMDVPLKAQNIQALAQSLPRQMGRALLVGAQAAGVGVGTQQFSQMLIDALAGNSSDKRKAVNPASEK